MDISLIVDELSDDEKRIYWTQTANDFFRSMFYSSKAMDISKRLENKEKITLEEWDYLVKRLFLVTCKAISEEDKVSFIDKVTYILSKIGKFISIKDGHLYNECYKMIEFIDSISMEKEINKDLLNGLDRVNDGKNCDDLNVFLRQHREAVIFRDNQDAYFDSYEDSYNGYITESERVYINSMYRSYLREKNLVNEYKK